MSRLGRLIPGTSAVFLCDLQERFRPAIPAFDSLLKTSKKLLDAAAVLQVPVIATEQNPRALGSLCSELDYKAEAPLRHLFDKMNFSMITDEVLVSLQGMPDLQSAVVVGIEAHVCVQQTVLDLLAEGYEVHLAVDAVSSQKSVDAQTAIERMRYAGCFVTTVDSILFEWMRTARHERFRDISKIVKGS